MRIMRRKLLQLLAAVVGIIAGVNAATAQPSFTFQSLQDLIAARHVHTVEQLLAELPSELRSHYVLVFASRSLQEANFRSPRVILFGRDARLIITFNGELGQRGYDSLETLEFESGSSTFRLREIRFEAGDPLAPPRISAVNPQRCTECHDTPARPIWDTPPSWPGVYGERYGAGLSEPELRGMREFLARQERHSRYRYLIGVNTLLDRSTYVADARSSYDGKTTEPPNAQLSALLATLNVKSILSQLAGRPGFSAHLDALLAAATDTCGPIADFYPESLHDRISEDYQRFVAATVGADERQQQVKSARHGGRSAARHALAAPTQLTALRFVAEHSLHTPTQHWTLAFERGTYDLSAPPGAVSFEQALFNWVATGDPELATAAAFRTYGQNDSYCEHLRLRSRASLEDWYGAHPVEAQPAGNSLAGVDDEDRAMRAAAVARSENREVSVSAAARTEAQEASVSAPAAPEIQDVSVSAPPLVAACVACHTGAVGPAIPFGDPVALRARLRSGHYPRGNLLAEILYRLNPAAGADRMPRGLEVDATQQHQLELYFTTLSH